MLSVAAFILSLGVNTHMDATRSGYGNVALVARSLAYIGVHTIRDHAWDVDLPAYRQLVAGGIKLDLIVDDDPAAATAAMVPIRAAIVAFEGANEVDVSGQSVAHAVAGQQALYAAVKTNPRLSGVPVLNESVGDPNNYTAYLATARFSDVTNLHAYAAWGDMPRYAIPGRVESETVAGKPSVITETGYFTMLSKVDPSGVSESVQARLTLDTVFDSVKASVSRTYLYELLDEAPDPRQTNSELHYGLFHADGTPKLAATALHNLTTILTASTTMGPPTPPLTPTFAGMTDEASSLPLGGANGESFIAVWSEPQVWNTAAQTELPATTCHIKVDLGAVVGAVSVYDPTVGSIPLATYRNVSKVSLDVTDHPLIIRASGPGSVPVPPP